MFLKLPWARKRMFWAFEKSLFQLFANFWVTKLKLFSGKGRQSVQDCLSENLGIRIFLENGFGETLSSKTNLLSVWKEYLQLFVNFWVTKWKPCSGKVRQNVQSYLLKNLVIGSFLEKYFEATLSSKANVLSVWKGHFSVFCKYLREVETVFREIGTNC